MPWEVCGTRRCHPATRPSPEDFGGDKMHLSHGEIGAAELGFLLLPSWVRVDPSPAASRSIPGSCGTGACTDRGEQEHPSTTTHTSCCSWSSKNSVWGLGGRPRTGGFPPGLQAGKETFCGHSAGCWARRHGHTPRLGEVSPGKALGARFLR